jgi:hypothetical protein
VSGKDVGGTGRYWIHFLSPVDKRLSIEYVRALLVGDFDIPLMEWLRRARARLTDYLQWVRSPLGKSTKRLGQAIVNEWAADQYPLIIQGLVKAGKEGSLKASELVLKSIGKADGTAEPPGGTTIEWVREVVLGPGGQITEERSSLTLKGQGVEFSPASLHNGASILNGAGETNHHDGRVKPELLPPP